MSTVLPQDIPYRIAFAQLRAHSLDVLAECVGHFGSATAAWEAPARAWHAFGLSEEAQSLAAELLERRASIDPHRLMRDITSRGCHVTVYGAADYPSALDHIPSPPPVLYYRGRLEALARPGVAVVGTRRASDYALRVSKHFSQGFAAAGVPVISGMALGVDQAAHRATLDAGGITFAVLGCGPDVCYPDNAARLKLEIEASGAVISQFAPGIQPVATHFPARNRVISGLAAAVLVVEAPAKSGALITADYALKQHRPLFAVPGNIFSPHAAGSHARLAEGTARPAVEPGDVLKAIDVQPASVAMRFLETAPATGAVVELDETTVRVWGVLSHEAQPHEALELEDILRRSEQPLTAVLSSLTRLELEGLIRRRVGNTYQRVR